MTSAPSTTHCVIWCGPAYTPSQGHVFVCAYVFVCCLSVHPADVDVNIGVVWMGFVAPLETEKYCMPETEYYLFSWPVGKLWKKWCKPESDYCFFAPLLEIVKNRRNSGIWVLVLCTLLYLSHNLIVEKIVVYWYFSFFPCSSPCYFFVFLFFPTPM